MFIYFFKASTKPLKTSWICGLWSCRSGEEPEIIIALRPHFEKQGFESSKLRAPLWLQTSGSWLPTWAVSVFWTLGQWGQLWDGKSSLAWDSSIVSPEEQHRSPGKHHSPFSLSHCPRGNAFINRWKWMCIPWNGSKSGSNLIPVGWSTYRTRRI